MISFCHITCVPHAFDSKHKILLIRKLINITVAMLTYISLNLFLGLAWLQMVLFVITSAYSLYTTPRVEVNKFSLY